MYDLSNVKVGEILASQQGYSDKVQLSAVVRITEKQIIAKDGKHEHRIWKQSGREVGQTGYDSNLWRIATDADFKKYEKDTMLIRLKKFDYKILDNKALEKIVSLVEKEMKIRKALLAWARCPDSQDLKKGK